MEIKLPYSQEKLTLEVPEENLLGVYNPKKVKVPDSPYNVIKEALENPIGTKKIEDIAEKGDSVAILVDDHTRPCPTHEILPPLLEKLYSQGIEDEDILIIFATGSHRPVTDEEARELLGKEIADRIEYVSNKCKKSPFVYLGKTSKGTPVEVNKLFLEADLKILTGDVEIHYFAGYGGGRKSVLPGITSYRSIQDNYTRNFFHEKAEPGRLDENPMYENMTEACEMAEPDFTVNVVETEDGIIGAYAGDFDQVLRKGAKKVDQAYKVKVEEKADIVVTAANGAPHDIDLYQAYKALHLALNVVKEGGDLILVAGCQEGFGSGVGAENYEKWMQQRKGKQEMKQDLEQEFTIGGHKAYYHLLASEKANIHLISSFEKELVENILNWDYAEDANQALKKAFQRQGKDAKVLVFPYGHNTLSKVKK